MNNAYKINDPSEAEDKLSALAADQTIVTGTLTVCYDGDEVTVKALEKLICIYREASVKADDIIWTSLRVYAGYMNPRQAAQAIGAIFDTWSVRKLDRMRIAITYTEDELGDDEVPRSFTIFDAPDEEGEE